MTQSQHPAAVGAAVGAAVEAAGEDPQRLVALAIELAADLPAPGRGGTAERWRVLADVAQVDLTAARVLEAHGDALAILAEAGWPALPGLPEPAGAGWGVFAAEAPGARVDARPSGSGSGVRLSGTKPWCSLAATLDHALVTAFVGDGTTPADRQLFAVDLHAPGVHARPVELWAARGLRAVPSTGLDLDDVAATPVGAPGWYLTRPGFAWGGMGVAACWLGGARGLAATVRSAAARRDDDLTALHVGTIDVALTAARCVLADAAARIDAGRADGAAGATLALRVRSVLADCAERVLHSAAHALGPAPLAFDPAHAARVADLGIYVRQHHAERDLAALGRAVLAEPQEPR